MSSDQLIDALWGARPPVDAPTALHAHVSRLRKLLEPDRDGRPTLLVTRSGGYALVVDDEQLDLRRFERLAASGRERLADGDAASAAERLREALALWRGPPLADLEGEPFAAGAVRELEESRLAAVESRIEAELALGAAAELVPELSALVARHPLDEPLRAQLMLALYRSGRRAEALDRFDAARREFASELGVEPGSRLRELHGRILAQDPGLDLRPPEPPAPPEPPSRSGAPRRRRRRGAALAAAAGLALAVAVAAVIVLAAAARDDDPARAADVGGLLRVDPVTAAVVQRVPAGDAVGAVSAGVGAIWSLDVDAQTVTRVDPAAPRAVPFGIGMTPTDLAAGAGAVWVAGGVPGSGTQSAGPVATTLARVDPVTRTVRARITLPRVRGPASELTEDHVAVERDAVWVIGPDFSLSRVDPRTDRVVAVVRGVQARAVAAGDAGVWVLGFDGTIARVDRATNRIAARDRIRASAVASLAVGGGAAWVSAPGDGTIWRVQPGPRFVMRTIDAGAGVGDLAFGAGALWAVNPLRGTLTRIDPGRNRITRTVGVGSVPRAVDAGPAGVWVAVGGDAVATRAVGAAASRPVHAGCEPTLYAGPGRPQRLIVTDLPLQGGVRLSAQQMAQASALVLRRRGFRAGAFRVGIQSCDDSVARTGLFDVGKCAANARAYARDRRVVAVVGTVNSPCSVAALPERARAPGGPLAMVSPLNSYVGLTRAAAGAPAGELASLYPAGRRHFLRVYPTDDRQADALAAVAADARRRRIVVLDDGDLLYGRALADRFAAAARARGLEVVLRRAWDPAASGYGALAAAVARARPDAVFLGGILDANGAGVLRAVRHAVGAGPRILLVDGFTPTDILLRQAGSAADGALLSVSGLVQESFGPQARRFAAALGALLGGLEVEPGAIYAAEATGVVLDALARSDGTRAGVLAQLFRTDLRSGLTGPVRFDARGDVAAPATTVLRVRRDSRSVPSHPDTVLERVVR